MKNGNIVLSPGNVGVFGRKIFQQTVWRAIELHVLTPGFGATSIVKFKGTEAYPLAGHDINVS